MLRRDDLKIKHHAEGGPGEQSSCLAREPLGSIPSTTQEKEGRVHLRSEAAFCFASLFISLFSIGFFSRRFMLWLRLA